MTTQVVFKNLQPSDFIAETIHQRALELNDKFPDLSPSRLVVTVAMDNSQFQPGPDHFSVKVRIVGGKFKEIALEKAAVSPYAAAAMVFEGMLERLNRHTDKVRVKARNSARQLQIKKSSGA
jgi:ribosome-associated translation inhibitor RaiA